MLRRLSQAQPLHQALSCSPSALYELLQSSCTPCAFAAPRLSLFTTPDATNLSSNLQRAALVPSVAQQHSRSFSCTPRAFSAASDSTRTTVQSIAEAAVPGMRQVSTRVVPKTGWAAVPPVPKFLGLFGLTPFMCLSPPVLISLTNATASSSMLAPLTHMLTHDLLPVAANLQIGYGIAIVSFLRAIHWGAAMQSRTGHTTKIMFERYIWSVMPALVAFPAAAVEPEMGSAMITMSLLAAFAVDAKFAYKGALPKWYMALRVPLTLGAMGGMLLTMWHEQAERQRILDYEHAVAEVPFTLDQETEAAMYR